MVFLFVEWNFDSSGVYESCRGQLRMLVYKYTDKSVAILLNSILFIISKDPQIQISCVPLVIIIFSYHQ